MIQIDYDGEAEKMVAGFPEVETQVTHVEVIARLPRFTSSGSYGFLLRPDRRDPAHLHQVMSTRQYQTESQSTQSYTTRTYSTMKTVIDIVQKDDKQDTVHKESQSSSKQHVQEKSDKPQNASNAYVFHVSIFLFNTCLLACLLRI